MNISESLDRILDSHDGFGEKFYEVFLNRVPEAKDHFAGVNLRRQGVLLTMALIVVEQYYSNPYIATERYLKYLGDRHRGLNIPPEMYGPWCNAMLETLQKFHGDEYTPELGEEWKEAIGRAVEMMIEGYQQGFHDD